MSVFEMAKTEVIKADVLVLGGGIAGCYAAINARESGADVVLVDKGNLGRSGFSCMISGVLHHFDPGKDDYDGLFRESVEAGEWINDQKWLEATIKESDNRIREMDKWGVKFQKEEGELLRRPVSGSFAGRNVLLTKSGLQLMSIFRGEVLRRGIRVVERVMVTELLTSDGQLPTKDRVTGATGFNIRNGSFYVFKAKATVIATGSTNSMYGYACQRNLSGDGKAMAFNAGCEFRNVELAYWQLSAVGQTTSAGLNVLVGEGTIIVNALGDRFMRKWDPQLMERAPRTVVGKAIAFEEREGRGPCYFDATNLDEISYGRIEKCIPIILRNFATRGLDIRKDKIHYSNVIGDEIIGGIRINKDCATTVSGLYAAGAASDSIGEGTGAGFGAVAAGNYGWYAGGAAAKYAVEIGEAIINEPQLQELREKTFAPMKRESGLNHRVVRSHCEQILKKGLLGPIKNERGLKEAIDVARQIRVEEIPELVAGDYHELARTIGLGNELLLLELFPRCSLLRTESRGSHFREDYPERDDEKWLKWVLARRESEDIKVWTEPIPFEDYLLKPK